MYSIESGNPTPTVYVFMLTNLVILVHKYINTDINIAEKNVELFCYSE